MLNTVGRAYRIYTKNTVNVPVQVSASAYYGNASSIIFDGGSTDVAPVAVELTLSDFTSVGLLTGTARTSYLGTKGSEVAG